MEAAAISDPAVIRDSLVRQVTGTVRWRESVAQMASLGVTRFIEVGAGKVLAGLVKRIAEGAEVVNIGGSRRYRSVFDAGGGLRRDAGERPALRWNSRAR